MKGCTASSLLSEHVYLHVFTNTAPGSDWSIWLVQINWMRAARTDKGVSAVGQLVSLKMVVGHTNYDIVHNINKHLPAQIRVLGYTKTTAGFDARKHCDKRRYEYVLPAWAFDPDACRSRLCVEEAELRSAGNPTPTDTSLPSSANPTAADGVLPAATAQGSFSAASDGESVPAHPDRQTQNASNTDAAAEATGAAVAAEAGVDTASVKQSEAAAPGADVPSPDKEPLTAAAGHAEGSPLGTSNGPVSAPASLQSSDLPEDAPSTRPASGTGLRPASGDASPDGPALDQDAALPSSSSFVFDDAAASRLTAILRQYEGTHNFHNFTVRLEATDPSAKRYMLSCRCAGTFQIQVIINTFISCSDVAYCVHYQDFDCTTGSGDRR